MSGRSSRSTLMLTNSSFITRAVAASSKLSCAITWHQWTGLCLCWSRYGEVSRARRFSCVAEEAGGADIDGPGAVSAGVYPDDNVQDIANGGWQRLIPHHLISLNELRKRLASVLASW